MKFTRPSSAILVLTQSQGTSRLSNDITCVFHWWRTRFSVAFSACSCVTNYQKRWLKKQLQKQNRNKKRNIPPCRHPSGDFNHLNWSEGEEVRLSSERSMFQHVFYHQNCFSGTFLALFYQDNTCFINIYKKLEALVSYSNENWNRWVFAAGRKPKNPFKNSLKA